MDLMHSLQQTLTCARLTRVYQSATQLLPYSTDLLQQLSPVAHTNPCHSLMYCCFTIDNLQIT